MPAIFQKMNLDKQTVVFSLTLGLLTVGGIWLLAYSTPEGLGINDDSIAYIAGARSIIVGQGYREAWLASNEPVVHFPPGFPGVLAAIGYVTGLDPVRGARALNGLLFGLNIMLTGWVGWRMTRLRIAGILAAVLTLFSSSLLYIHTRVMSEPLYIFLVLLAFLLLDYFFERSKTIYLVALGFALGWAYLARYAGLSLLATMIMVLLVIHGSWRERWKSVSILALSAFPWILGWSLRNRIVGGTFTNRVLGWHPVTFENWRKARGTFADFIVPVHEWQKAINNIPGFFTIVPILIIVALLAWVLVKGLPRFFRPERDSQSEALPFTNALYVIAYLLLLITTMTLFDPATKFQVRILSPTYISLLLLLIFLGAWLWRKKTVTWKPVITIFAIGMIGMFAYGQILSVQDLRKGGDAFAGERWFDSEVIPVLKQIPSDVLILTNEPGVVYLYTGRPSGTLPKTEPGISMIKPAVLDGEVVIVLFRVNRVNAETLDYYYELGRGLYQWDFSHTWLFSDFPE
jgi:4-amino-4-deoxy-L-arabinose transferase-like glycosyltransferase